MSFSNWNELCEQLGNQFNIDVDLNGVLFLVGIRERGLTFQPFTKEEKLSLINLGQLHPLSGDGIDRKNRHRQGRLAHL